MLEWFVCGFENFINQMVKLPRHATEQPTAWPSPIFFISFSNWFLCSAHKYLSATLPRPPTAPPVTAATWICLHDHFYSNLTILSKKQKVAHNQLNAEGLVSSAAQKTIKEILGHREGKENTSPHPLEWRKGEEKEKEFIPG